MIGEYLPQTNKSATVAKSKKFSYLNKALVWKKFVLLDDDRQLGGLSTWYPGGFLKTERTSCLVYNVR